MNAFGRNSLVIVVAGLAVTLAGCSKGGGYSFTDGGAGDPSISVAPEPPVGSGTDGPVPTTTAGKGIPKDCSVLGTQQDAGTALGQALPGTAKGVPGTADSSVGRTSKLDCYFGVPASGQVAAAAIVITIAGYNTPQSAGSRVTLTVDAAKKSGFQASQVQVAGQQAVLLAGKNEHELVFATGTMTVLAVAKHGIAPVDKLGPALIELAQRAVA
jgi:hypothetical protein